MHTGDVGYIDAAGNLQITDRMKDVIKSGGEWVSSLALESIASAVGGVGEVAAIGIPDPQWGERPLLLIVAVEGCEHSAVERRSAWCSTPRWRPENCQNGLCRKTSGLLLKSLRPASARSTRRRYRAGLA